MKNITNPVYLELKKMKIINDKNIIKISNKTRDKNISVYKDLISSVIFLEKYQTGGSYYSKIKYGNSPKGKKATTQLSKKENLETAIINDDMRRSLQFKKLVKNKSVLDFGCGWGMFLKNIKDSASNLSGVERREECIQFIKKSSNKINIHSDLISIKEKFDVITSFHVLEHVPNQVETIVQLKKRLKSRGKLIIEVPHAKDFLLEFENLKEFKKFTFWSEHLLLHTEHSLKKVLEKAGFKKIKISFYQRYNFANHLGWFINRKPGGHDFFSHLSEKMMNKAYNEYLTNRKLTDTLIAEAQL